jgi:protein required for attachment to host cells
MADVREDILARLLEVVATIPNLRSAYRNNEDIAETDLPAGLVMDGNEETNESQNRQSNSSAIVQMTPEVLIFHQNPNFSSEFDVLRRELIKRVLTDTELNNLVAKSTPRGGPAIRYLGCQIGHAWLRSLCGAMKAQFLFKYTLWPDNL